MPDVVFKRRCYTFKRGNQLRDDGVKFWIIREAKNLNWNRPFCNFLSQCLKEAINITEKRWRRNSRVNEEIEKSMRPLRSKVDHVQNRIVKLEGSKADLNRVTSLANQQMYPNPQNSINKLTMQLLIDSEESKDFRRKHSVDARRTSKKRPNSICCYQCGRMGHSVKSCYLSLLKKE